MIADLDTLLIALYVELTEVIQDAWLAQASRARATAWLGGQPGR